MESMEDKLGAILGNPQMMQQIMSMAQALGASAPEESSPPPPEPPKAQPAMSLDGLDPAMLGKIAGIASQTGIDPHQKALLSALDPYLNHHHISKLEKAMRAAKIAGIATSVLGSGMLSGLLGR